MPTYSNYCLKFRPSWNWHMNFDELDVELDWTNLAMLEDLVKIVEKDLDMMTDEVADP